ncbi:MAG: hypothetical protein DI637_10420 [Citromicrobium sp.]|nr:MAG: hypothetical protein DI637_10420 [Citromicrobium sp.]
MHTINQGRFVLTESCDPKGSEQFCIEFSPIRGGLLAGRPFFSMPLHFAAKVILSGSSQSVLFAVELDSFYG